MYIEEQEPEEKKVQPGEMPEIGAPAPSIGGGAAPGGQAVGQPAPVKRQQGSSSGAFKDFGKFQEANKAKLQALQGMTQQRAKEQVGEAQKGFEGAVQQSQQDIAAQGQIGDFGGLTAASLPQEQENLQTALNTAGQAVNAEDYMQPATEAGQTYGQAAQQLTEAKDIAGIQNLLTGQGEQASAISAKANAALLSADPRFRTQMSQLAAQEQAAADTALGALPGTLETAAQQATTARTDAGTALREQLTGLGTGIQDTLASGVEKAHASEAERAAQAETEALQRLEQLILNQAPQVQAVASDPNDPNAASITAPGTTLDFGQAVGGLFDDPAKFKEATGLDLNELLQPEVDAALAATNKQITTGDILADSPESAAQLQALANLGIIDAMPTAAEGVGAATRGEIGSEASLNKLIEQLMPSLQTYAETQRGKQDIDIPTATATPVAATASPAGALPVDTTSGIDQATGLPVNIPTKTKYSGWKPTRTKTRWG